MRVCAVSAPGKVLAAGGYLVLDARYVGVVLATTARFYAIVHLKPTLCIDRCALTLQSPLDVIIKSPQFLDDERKYLLSLIIDSARTSTLNEELAMPEVQTSKSSSPNPYIDIALRLSLVYACGVLGIDAFKQSLTLSDQSTQKATLEINMLGDNDFYSQRAELSARQLSADSDGLRALPPFASTHTHLRDVHKTGLGSSAALVTSLVGALLAFFLPQQSLQQQRLTVHNLAQLCHCAAQGKIGSGFDVSAAVWGTHVYRRFSPKILESLLNKSVETINFTDLCTIIPFNETMQTVWDNTIRSFALPPGIQLLLGDVSCGSNTPSMVSKVLKWKNEHPELSQTLWNQIDKLNNTIEASLTTIYNDHNAQKPNHTIYWTTLERLATLSSTKWPSLLTLSCNELEYSTTLVKHFIELNQTGNALRAKMCKLSQLANVPVEPIQQTKLLDACMQVPGCVIGGVPGAGGFDAIYLLYLNPCYSQSHHPTTDTVRCQLEQLWRGYSELSVCPLLSGACNDGLHNEVIDAESVSSKLNKYL